MNTNACCNCGYIGKLENHHVVPKVMGGAFTVPLCVKCHGLVHGRDFVKSRNLQLIGIEKAKLNGKYKGGNRKPETFDNWIKKKYIKEICVYRINTNYSYRDISETVGCSLSTVQKVYKLISYDVAAAIAKEQTINIEKVLKKEILINRYQNKINKLTQI
jgi:hypothetical protein